jgi:hypothetical protein
MTTMTMRRDAGQHDAGTTFVQRVEPRDTKSVSQFTPILVAFALLVTTGLASVLVFGPMH